MKNRDILTLVLAILGLAVVSYWLGRDTAPGTTCEHQKEYQIDVAGGGVMLIIPNDRYAVQVLGKSGRPYQRGEED